MTVNMGPHNKYDDQLSPQERAYILGAILCKDNNSGLTREQLMTYSTELIAGYDAEMKDLNGTILLPWGAVALIANQLCKQRLPNV